MTKALRVEKLTSFDEFLSLESTWRELLERDTQAKIYQTFEWHKAFWEALGKRYNLSLLVMYRGANPVAIFPAMQSLRWVEGLPLKRVALIGGDDFISDYLSPIIDSRMTSSEVSEVFAAAMSSWSDSQMIEFFNVREDSILFPVLRRHTNSFVVSPYSAWQCPLDENDPDCLLRRRSLKKAVRRLNKRLEYRVEHLFDSKEIEPQLDEFFALHTKRWKYGRGYCQFRRSSQRELYYAMVRNLSPRREVMLSTLRGDGKLLAAHFGFWFRKSLYWYKPAFDPDYEELSLGNVVLFDACQFMSDLGAQVLDFTVGDEPFKRRYASSQIKMYRVRIPVSSWLTRYFQTLESMRTLKRRVLNRESCSGILGSS